jgi:hypothetical protein
LPCAARACVRPQTVGTTPASTPPPPCGSAFPLPSRPVSLCHVGREGPPPRHAIELEGLEGLGAPVQRRDHAAARAERGEVEGVPPLEEEVVVAVVRRRPSAAFVKRGSGLSSSKYPSPRPLSKSERREKGREGSEIAKRLRDGGGRCSTHPHEDPVEQTSPTPPPANAFRGVGKEAVSERDPSRADADAAALTLPLPRPPNLPYVCCYCYCV